jgi:hypothetical protein
MSLRRTQPPRKRPGAASVAEGLGAPVVAPDMNANASDLGTDANAELRAGLLAKLEATVNANPDLDDAGRDFLMRHYREAVATAPIQPTLVAKPDRQQWVGILESLQADGLASEDSVASLVRKFDAAMEPLDSPQLETALEFARRCEQDGQEKALQWLEARRAAASESKRATAEGKREEDPAPQTSAGSRRVRSPRGPPA